jgi:hypothetical protein
MVETLGPGKGEVLFELSVQLLPGATAEQIDTPTVEWQTPFQPVARLRIPSQRFDTEERMSFCENLTYTPWHALPEHRPLGEVNEIRRAVYLASSALRHERRGTPVSEPSEGSL